MLGKNLNRELYESAEEGLILGIDVDEYKIVRHPTITLNVVDNVGFDSEGNYICNMKSYVSDNMYDVDPVTLDVIRERPDKVYSDSPKVIEDMKGVISYKEFLNMSVLNPVRKQFNGKIKITTNENTSVRDVEKAGVLVNLLTGNRRADQRQTKHEMMGAYFYNGRELGKNVVEDFFAKGKFVKNNLVYNLTSPVKWKGGGLSTGPLPGYDVVSCDDISIGYHSYFSYRGIFLIYYDPEIWVLNNKKLVQSYHISDCGIITRKLDYTRSENKKIQ